MSEVKQIPYKIYLEEHEMPKYWYNVRADIVPILRHLMLFEVNLVGDLLDFAHGDAPF